MRKKLSEYQTQEYVSNFYGKRYSGNGLVYHNWVANKLLPDRKCDKILDVGCGTGFMMEKAENIVGIDFSQGMLDKNPYKERAHHGDAQKIPFPGDYFDHVICRALLHHVPEPKIAISEMYRVLKPGGTVSILETNASIISRVPRKLMIKFTNRFSDDHKNFEFEEIKDLIEEKFLIEEVEFVGLIAYFFIGFPDFINIPMPRRVALWLIELDKRLSKSPLKKLAFNVLFQAKKLKEG